MTYPLDFYEPRNGIRPGMVPPTSLDWRYPDPDNPLMVHLAVHAYPVPSQPRPRDRLWSLFWEQGWALSGRTPVMIARFLETRREDGMEHYTHWGPVARAAALHMEGARVVPLAVLSLAQRKGIEKLAGTVRVMKPNGWWNGQNWIVELLNRAVEEDIITPQQRDAALVAAAQP